MLKHVAKLNGSLIFFIVPMALLFLLLFIEAPSKSTYFSKAEFWQLGHLVLFFCIVHLFLAIPSIATLNAFKQFGLSFALCFSLAIATESAQLIVGKKFRTWRYL